MGTYFGGVGKARKGTANSGVFGVSLSSYNDTRFRPCLLQEGMQLSINIHKRNGRPY